MTTGELFISSKRYPEEFKIEAVKQFSERGHSVAEVARRLCNITHSLYTWLKQYGPLADEHHAHRNDQAEIKRLQKELKRVTKERDILKKSAAYFANHPESGTPSSVTIAGCSLSAVSVIC